MGACLENEVCIGEDCAETDTVGECRKSRGRRRLDCTPDLDVETSDSSLRRREFGEMRGGYCS
jgi:hypothetical protein